jgi:hypothetical protein
MGSTGGVTAPQLFAEELSRRLAVAPLTCQYTKGRTTTTAPEARNFARTCDSAQRGDRIRSNFAAPPFVFIGPSCPLASSPEIGASRFVDIGRMSVTIATRGKGPALLLVDGSNISLPTRDRRVATIGLGTSAELSVCQPKNVATFADIG